VGYEFAKGEGMTVVKLLGEIGAVKAAVAAGAQAASRVNRVVSTDVIARPGDGVAGLVASADTVGQQVEMPPQAEPAAASAVTVPETEQEPLSEPEQATIEEPAAQAAEPPAMVKEPEPEFVAPKAAPDLEVAAKKAALPKAARKVTPQVGNKRSGGDSSGTSRALEPTSH